MDLNFRGKGRFELSYGPKVLIFCALSVSPNLIWVRCTKNFNANNVWGLKLQSNVLSCRKEPEIEGLKHIFFEVLFLHCAKVVESFDIFEVFTYLRLEIRWNTDNGWVYVILFSITLNNLFAISKTVISDVCKHNYSVFWLLLFMIAHPNFQFLTWFLKPINDCCATLGKNTVNSFVYVWGYLIFQCLLN